MARWNNDLTILEGLTIGTETTLVIIYLFFITKIAIQLHKNKKKINAFVCATLVFIGISIILA